MKTWKNKFAIIAYYFAITIFFQGCVVYHNTPVTLEQATKEITRAKVKTTKDETYRFKHIGFEDGMFYGLKKTQGEYVRIPLDSNEISKIVLQNKTLSTILTISIPVVILTLIIVSAAAVATASLLTY
ncbi:hypothetical protein ACFLR9_05205 [Bacteroidota bacterium]